jgi:S-adenosylmethionine:tRNA-ribosyltransferase-isomerase (queuine synthetase)
MCGVNAAPRLDRERYQTVYAAHLALRAPTAGFHFTPELLAALGSGIDHTLLTLHVGPGTFSWRRRQLKITAWKGNATRLPRRQRGKSIAPAS